MLSKPLPPLGSKIMMEELYTGVKYSWSNKRKMGSTIPVVLFMCVWLVGWLFGEIMALKQIFFSGNFSGPILFLIVWLILWTVGGSWAFILVLRFVRASKPSELTFSDEVLIYNTGLEKPVFAFSGQSQNQLKSLFSIPKKKEYVMQYSFISNIKTERVNGELKLTLDFNMKRIEIGNTLSEPEKEWLLSVLQENIEN